MKSRVFMSLLVIALAAALVGGATMAWFTDEAQTKDVTFQAGTLMIDVDKPGVTKPCGVTLDRLNPGDCWKYEFYVYNVGTKSADWLLYLCWQDVIGRDNGHAFGQREDFGTDPLSGAVKWTINVDEKLVYDDVLPVKGPLKLDMEQFGLGNADKSVKQKVTVTACLPTGAGNEYQGAKMDVVFGAKAWQTTNEAGDDPANRAVVCPFGNEED